MSKGKLSKLNPKEHRFFKNTLEEYDKIQSDIQQHTDVIEEMVAKISKEKALVQELLEKSIRLKAEENNMYELLAKINDMSVNEVKEAIFYIFSKNN